jgi:hypothetical protein
MTSKSTGIAALTLVTLLAGCGNNDQYQHTRELIRTGMLQADKIVIGYGKDFHPAEKTAENKEQTIFQDPYRMPQITLAKREMKEYLKQALGHELGEIELAAVSDSVEDFLDHMKTETQKMRSERGITKPYAIGMTADTVTFDMNHDNTFGGFPSKDRYERMVSDYARETMGVATSEQHRKRAFSYVRGGK